MVRREPKKHHADCYFCMVYTKGFNSKVKHAASYPDIPSAKTIISRYPIIEDQLTIVLKYPFPYFLACLVYRVKALAVHKMKMMWSQILIFTFRPHWNRHHSNRKNWVILWKTCAHRKSNQRFWHQGSDRKLFSAQIPKLLFMENEKQNFFNTLLLKMILFTITMSKGFCWQLVSQNINQLIGDSSSTIQNEAWSVFFCTIQNIKSMELCRLCILLNWKRNMRI